MPNVVFTGWKQGLAKVGLNKLFQSRAGLSLSAAKAAVDRILEGHPVVLTLDSAREAQDLAREAQMLGAECSVVEDG